MSLQAEPKVAPSQAVAVQRLLAASAGMITLHYGGGDEGALAAALGQLLRAARTATQATDALPAELQPAGWRR